MEAGGVNSVHRFQLTLDRVPSFRVRESTAFIHSPFLPSVPYAKTETIGSASRDTREASHRFPFLSFEKLICPFAEGGGEGREEGQKERSLPPSIAANNPPILASILIFPLPSPRSRRRRDDRTDGRTESRERTNRAATRLGTPECPTTAPRAHPPLSITLRHRRDQIDRRSTVSSVIGDPRVYR